MEFPRPHTRPELTGQPEAIVAAVQELHTLDAPTHGGHVLSYVYDTGEQVIDDLAAAAARVVQSVNGLDPTTFPSVAVMERDLIRFTRDMLHGDSSVFGNVTSGGTESCLLAVRTARDVWRLGREPYAVARMVAPSTVHAVFRKAAKYFDVILDEVPVDPATGRVDPADIEARLGDDVALVVLSAPNYPYAQLDPIAQLGPVLAERGIALHVDACIGGFALPWWQGIETPWDFAVPGVTSISADLHKYGYAPKGASVLLHRGAQRHRQQYFAITNWPGYPVVNPTIMGSKSAGPVAAAWAIVEYLGADGFARKVADMQEATAALVAGINAIEGLRVQGAPAGPLLAVVSDDSVPPDRRVNPHLLVDEVRASGWVLQSQPGHVQGDGTLLPQSAHMTITPVTHGKTDELLAAIGTAADVVRGRPGALEDPGVLAAVEAITAQFAALGVGPGGEGIEAVPTEAVVGLLGALGMSAEMAAQGQIPPSMADLLAVSQLLPEPLSNRLLTEILAQVVEPA